MAKTQVRAAVIDADGHVVEPPTMLYDYIDSKFRDRTPRVVKQEDHPGTVAMLMEEVDKLPKDQQRLVLGENCRKLYNLDLP